MISCDEAAHICSKKQYKEASWSERFQLILHLVICKTCRVFSRKNSKLTALCEQARLHGLSQKDKQEMKRRLQE